MYKKGKRVWELSPLTQSRMQLSKLNQRIIEKLKLINTNP